MQNGYAVFVFDLLYPAGGWRDFVGHFQTLPQAESAAEDALGRHLGDYYQIVSETTDSIVEEGRLPPRSPARV